MNIVDRDGGSLNQNHNNGTKKQKARNRTSEHVKTVVEMDLEEEVQSDSSCLNSRRLPPLVDNDATRQKKKQQQMELPLRSPTVSEASQQQQQKKKKSKAVIGSQETLLLQDDKKSETIPIQTIKKKRKRKPQSEVGTLNIGLATELYELSEDVVPVDDNIKSYNDTIFTVPVMRSEPASKVFIEKKDGFKARDKAKVTQQRAEARERQQALAAAAVAAGSISKQNTIEFALSTHRIFKIISVFLQGLFAGIALWQIIASYMLLNAGSTTFLTNYYMLASPVQCLFYFLFAVSTVAVLDRYDLARPTRTLFAKSVTLQAGTIAVCFYFIGLVFSLATVFIDERISLYGIDPLLWTNNTQVENTDTYLFQWRILNLIRGITAILGWFVISLRPSTDRLTKNLLSADENFLAPVMQSAA